MLKRTLKKLLQETTDKLNLTLLENRQLRERLDEYEKSNDSEEKESLLTKLKEAEDENQKIIAQNESKILEYETVIKELEERNNELNQSLNKLKGEHFDTCKYADDLKQRLDNLVKEEGKSVKEISYTIPEPPPTPQVVTAEEKDEESFSYASGIISDAVVHTATVTARLSASDDKNANELKALAMGRSEILKADVLQTVMSDMLPEAKRTRMDKLLAETLDYFDGIIGQLEK